MAEKEKYFVNVQSKEISKVEVGNNKEFTIYATEGEVSMLRKKFDEIDTTEMDNFFRAHVPIVPYHKDTSNDKYDSLLTEIFQQLYELGDDATKKFIEKENLYSNQLHK